MARLEPHKISTKLCRLFDNGYSNPRQFASECDVPVHTIEDVANKPGFRINRDLELRIGRVLSAYLRRYPELYRIIDAPVPPKRGVEEVELRARDWRGFEVVNSKGKCIMYVEWPRESTTQSRIDGLWKWLEREDPQPVLRAI